jgi:hypothetical protein
MMDVKTKIEEMDRISKEIQAELDTARLYFAWTITMHNSRGDAAALGLNVQFHNLREELYGDLIKGGMLPPGSGQAKSPKPEGQ